MKKLRILLLSEQNNPNWVSVPLVGFRHGEALAKIHEVHLVTHRQNQLDHLQGAKVFHEITFIGLGWFDGLYAWIFRVLFKGDFGSQALTAVRLPFYLLFEYLAWRKLKLRVRQNQFDCVLRLTPVAPVLPSPWANWLKGSPVPFIIGPINGGLPFPTGFKQAQRQREWVSGLRMMYRYLPFAQSTYKSAAAIICGSSQTCQEFSRYSEKVFFVPENGINLSMFEQKKAKNNFSDPLRLLFVGRLVPFKACDLAIRGAAEILRSRKAVLTIVGEGDERRALELLTQELGVADCVNFTGELPHHEAMLHFSNADILLFPSIREFGGGVVYEALASGTVPLVADYGGPGDIVSAAVGFKIPMTEEASAVDYIRRVLAELDFDRLKLHKLSQAGQDFGRDALTWNGKAVHMTSILNWTLGRGPKPKK